MTMKVHGPNGVTVNFPDGTDNQTINRVMNEAMSKAQSGGNDAEAIKAKAATMSADDKQMYRIKNRDALAEYLMNEVQQPKPGETPEQTEQRLAYGSGKPLSAPTKLQSFVGGAADTLSWGAGDEMAAGIGTLMGNGNYEQNLARQRELRDTLSQENPKTYVAGQVGGALAPALVTGGTSSGSSLGGRMLIGSATGAGQGAGYGFNSADGDLSNRAWSAGTNALVGAGLGAGAPVLAKGIGATWNGIAGLIRNSGMEAKTQNVLLDMMQKSGMKPDQAWQRLNELGPEGMLADITPGMQAEAAGTAVANPNVLNLMAERLASRRTAGRDRLAQGLDNVFGPAEDPFTVREGTKVAKAGISPAYEAALKAAPELPQHAQEAFGDSFMSQLAGMSESNRKVALSISNQIDDALGGGTPELAGHRVLDLRHSLDAQIVHDPRQWGMLSPADRAQQSVLKTMRGYVDRLAKSIPGIAEADAEHAPLSRQQSAYDYGRRELLRGGSNTISPAEATSRFQGMTPAERRMTEQGVRTEIDRVMSNQRGNPEASLDRLTSRDWNGDKLNSLLGNQRAEQLGRHIDRENTFTSTSRLIEPSQGSRTAILSEAARRWRPSEATGLLSDMASAFAGGSATGNPVAGLLSAGSVAARRLTGRAFTKSNGTKLGNAVGDTLTRQGHSRDRVMESLLGRTAKNEVMKLNGKSRETIINGLLGNSVRIPLILSGLSAHERAAPAR